MLSPPKALLTPDTAALQKVCANYMEELASDGFDNGDIAQHVFECAMQTYYGPEIFSYLDARLEEKA